MASMLPMRQGNVPPFHELGELQFEDLCRELVQLEHDVDTADWYGTRGQGDRGVDLLIHHTDGSFAAGQCKAHAECTEALIREACDEFLKNHEFWRDYGVKKFVLFVAAATRRTQLHQERQEQRKRLEAAGFRFSVWSGAALLTKLRHQRNIVRTYFPWQEPYICGAETELELQSNLQKATIDALSGQLAEAKEDEHAGIRRLWQEGRPLEALRRLQGLKANSLAWDALPSATRAKNLRLEARLVLTTGDIHTAKSLSTEADRLHAPDNARLAAMIAQAEGRFQDAIDALTDHADPDSQALKAAVQIQAGLPDDAMATLSRFPDHADACRLRAVILFVHRRSPREAKAEAERAVELAPTWYWMRFTAATLRYFVGWSPVALPVGIPEWPEPISPSLLRQDDESVAERKMAAEEFRNLLTSAFEHSAHQRSCLEAWHVASLADTPDSKSQGSTIAARILKANPSNYRVLVWVLGRDLDVDVTDAVGELGRQLDAGLAGAEEAVALVAAHTKALRFTEARSALERSLELFVRENSRPLWDLWWLQVARAESECSGQATDRAELIEAAMQARRDSEATGDKADSWQQLFQLARLGAWEQIAPIAEELVQAIQTPDAARAAAYALYNTHDLAGCLRVLANAPQLFPGGDLPPDLCRLSILAQRGVGDVRQAIRTAKALFERAPSKDTLLEVVRLCVLVGDTKDAAVFAREHSSLSGMMAAEYLQLASYVKSEDPSLALTLWRKANEQGIEDEHVGAAFQIGTSLGADAELKSLVHRISAFGQEGREGVQSFRLEELRDWMTARREQLDRIWQLLRSGQTPNHFALPALGVDMARAFHRLPLETSARTNGTSAGPVFQRFGGRLAGSLPRDTERWRLNADITAILSAAHFDLLTCVESHFAPIRVPHNTVVALIEIRDSLLASQPKRIDATRQVMQAVSAGRISRIHPDDIVERLADEGDAADDVLCLLRAADAGRSLVLEFLPVRSMDPLHSVTVLPPRFEACLRDSHSVVLALVAAGTLSSSEGERAIELLGERHGIPSQSDIPAGGRILCRGDVVEMLALAGVLEQAAATFKLSIPADDIRRAQNELDAVAVSATDAEWVQGVVGRLSRGLVSGLYELLPQMAEPAASTGRGHTPGLAEGILYDLMRFPGADGDVIWSDDRFVTSYENRDQIPIAGTVDVLTWLHDLGKIPTEELRRVLTEMRAADVRFVPFVKEELLAAVLGSRLEVGRVVETRTLRTLRQYYARCVREADMLRAPTNTNGTPNPLNEWAFLSGCGRAVVTVMVAVWESGPASDAAIRADWLFRYMYNDDRGIHGTQMLQAGATDVYRVGVSLTSLITAAIPLDGPEGERTSRVGYYAWLYDRVLRPRFEADKAIGALVVDQLKQTVAQLITEQRDELRGPTRGLFQRMWADLPNGLQELLNVDHAFLAGIGVSHKSLIEIGPLRFDPAVAWDSLAQALRGANTIEIADASGQMAAFRLENRHPIRFSISSPAAGFGGELERPELGFLSDSVAERRASVDAVAWWFDAPKSRREKVISGVIEGQDAAARIDLALESQAASGEQFYRQFAENIRAGESFHLSDAIPKNPRILLDHLRIERASDTSPDWSRVVGDLTDDVGPVAAILRLSGLPVSLGIHLANRVAFLSPVERRRTLRVTRRILLGSPVGIVHLADLWNNLPGIPDRRVRAVIGKLCRLLGDEKQRPVFEAWLVVLQRVGDEFGFDEGLRELSTSTRLALVWTHADRIFRILLARGLPPGWIGEAFERGGHLLDSEIVFPDRAYSDDIAAPGSLRKADFALAALDRMSGASTLSPDGQAVITKWMSDRDTAGPLLAAMLCDNDAAANALDGWLSTGRRWLRLISDDLQPTFTAEATKATVAKAGARIANGEDLILSWSQIGATIRHLPPPGYALPVLEKALGSVKLVDCLARDAVLASIVVRIIAGQGRHLSDDLAAHVGAELLLLAARVEGAALEEADLEALAAAISSGLVACTWLRLRGEAGATTLAQAVRRLADDDAMAVLHRVGRLVVRLCEALPVGEARLLWQTRDLIRVRTRA